jgi:hypothetical protein
LIVGTGYNSNDGINFGENSSYGINASFIVPLGGSIGKNCEGIANTIAHKVQYDLEIINARACAELISAGVSLNSEKFPTLYLVCDGVSLVKNNFNQPKESVRFQPEDLQDDESEENNNYE